MIAFQGGINMKIVNSTIDMASNHTYLETQQKEEQLRIWVGNTRPNFEGQPAEQAGLPEAKAFILELSEKSQATLKQQVMTAQTPVAQPTGATESTEEVELSEKDRLKITLIEKMIEMFTGKKTKIKLPKLHKASDQSSTSNIQSQPTQAAPIQAPTKQGWGLEYDYHEVRYEREQMSFSAEGQVKTADGQTINFSVQLNMAREFYQEKNLSLRAGDAVKIDPLVLNFNGAAAELTDTKFSFDLDSDGREEQISFVGPGSGFLALDSNEDNVINNGRELFGPNSVNGFAALAQYDEDQNGWIDENDSVFDKLRIWTKDAQGNDSLFALGQKGIGAIYLGNIDSPFQIKNAENTLQGEVKRSGIYLKEDGSAQTVQQVDLTI